MQNRITFDDISAAERRGRGVVLETPMLPSLSFGDLIGTDIWLKAENLQRTGSFKVRGAMNAVALLDTDARNAGVVAASAGNHAQGVALAAVEHGVRATVFMPEFAAIPKVEATKSYGAEVVLAGTSLAEATDHALSYVDRTGATFLHPFDDRAIIAGQGTLGLEMQRQVPDLDTVLIPLGGGGLISGTAIAMKHENPSLQIIGVQSASVPTYVQARIKGVANEIDPEPTIADGIAVSRPSGMCFSIIEELVDDLITVTDDQATDAVALLLGRAKHLVEPSGAVGLAAMLHGIVEGTGRTGVVLSGGNVDLLLLDGIVRKGMEARGRYASLTVVVPDEPGSLAAVLSTVAAQGANVVSVEHHRHGRGLEYGDVEIHFALETRGHEHIDLVVAALSEYGATVHSES